MRLNKKNFLKTELGQNLYACIVDWDESLQMGKKESAHWCLAQWNVYRMVLNQFYGVDYYFTRTDTYFGVCTEDESDYLFKVERDL